MGCPPIRLLVLGHRHCSFCFCILRIVMVTKWGTRVREIHHFCAVLFVLSRCLFQVHSQQVNTNLLCEVPEDSLTPRRTLESNCTECFPGLDLSTDCSTCEGESIQCVEGEQNCGVGNFTFSAMFHSYENPNHLCAECDQNGDAIITCEASSNMNADTNCGLRFIYCLRPHGSDVIDVPLPGQPALSPGTDDITFTEGLMTQIGGGGTGGPRGNNVWNRSNPFTQELRLWPGRVQFYIVVYYFRFGISEPDVVDRFQIDLELSIASDFTERKTYYGLQNLTQFDMSFKIRQCSDNYYGPQCDVFCSEVEGQFTCDSEGNTVCVNSNLNPETSCTECLEEDQDPDNNCGVTDIPTTSPNTDSTTDSIISPNTDSTSSPGIDSSPDTSNADTPLSSVLVGGVVGGVLGGILLLVLVLFLLFCICVCVKRNKKDSTHTVANNANKSNNFANPVYGNGDDIKESSADTPPINGTNVSATIVVTADADGQTHDFSIVDPPPPVPAAPVEYSSAHDYSIVDPPPPPAPAAPAGYSTAHNYDPVGPGHAINPVRGPAHDYSTVEPAGTDSSTPAATAAAAAGTATGPGNMEERKFDNPIYGNELTSNVYSTPNPIGPDYSNTAHIGTAGANEAGTNSSYSRTSHEKAFSVEPADVGGGAVYDMAFPDGSGQEAVIGTRYEQAAGFRLDPATSSGLYNELEDHTYSAPTHVGVASTGRGANRTYSQTNHGLMSPIEQLPGAEDGAMYDMAFPEGSPQSAELGTRYEQAVGYQQDPAVPTLLYSELERPT